MEELVQLRKFIETAHYAEALALLDDLEEMSRDDKINNILRKVFHDAMGIIKQQRHKA